MKTGNEKIINMGLPLYLFQSNIEYNLLKSTLSWATKYTGDSVAANTAANNAAIGIIGANIAI